MGGGTVPHSQPKPTSPDSSCLGRQLSWAPKTPQINRQKKSIDSFKMNLPPRGLLPAATVQTTPPPPPPGRRGRKSRTLQWGLQAPNLSSDGGGEKTGCLRGEFPCLPRVEMLVAGPELAGGQADRPLPLVGSKSQACLPLGPTEQGERGR